MDADLKFIINVAENAGEMLREAFFKKHEVKVKSDKTLVTEMDKVVERFIINKINERFPGHGIISEEAGEMGKGKEACWVVDPLDGTTNYTLRVPFFNVAITFVKNSVPLIAVVHAPMTGETFYAKRDEGAFLNGKRIHVSKVDRLEDSIFCYCRNRSYISNFIPMFSRLAGVVRDINRLRSAELELSMVACGRIEGFFYTNVKLWDVIAGSLLVEEAGGKVTDFEGNPWNINSNDLLATNGRVHDELLEIMRDAFQKT